jgi:Recombinase zinc beta ribbon domain
VSWEDFERIQKMLASNVLGSADPSGAARRGSALLTGLLRCRRCARMLRVFYKGNEGGSVRYACVRASLDNKEARCVAFSGAPIDQVVATEILRVVQPAVIEAAVSAHQQQVSQHEEILVALRQDLEAARYRAQRAQRQYDATDPANRLVAGELEQRWNRALQEVQSIELRLAEETQVREQVSVASVEEFEALGADLEAVWNDPRADERTKKRILRTLIRELIVDIDSQTSEVVLVIHWKGGAHTPLRLPRRRRGQNSAHTSKETVEAVGILARICNDDMIAGVLNRQGVRTARGNYWTRVLVTSLRRNHEIACHSAQRQEAEGWMNLSHAAALLGMANRTLRSAIERGEIEAERPIACGPWVLNQRALQTEAAVRFAEQVRLGRKTPAVPASTQAALDLSIT